MTSISRSDFIEIIKFAAQELRRLDSELGYQKKLNEAVDMVEPLENKGYHFKGASKKEKAEALLARTDFDKLSYLAKEAPNSYGEFGKVGGVSSPEPMDSFTRYVNVMD